MLDPVDVTVVFDLQAVEDVLRRARGKRGAAALRRVIAAHRPLNVHEGLEELFAALILGTRLDRPLFNAFVEGETRTHQVDAYWPATAPFGGSRGYWRKRPSPKPFALTAR